MGRIRFLPTPCTPWTGLEVSHVSLCQCTSNTSRGTICDSNAPNLGHHHDTLSRKVLLRGAQGIDLRVFCRESPCVDSASTTNDCRGQPSQTQSMACFTEEQQADRHLTPSLLSPCGRFGGLNMPPPRLHVGPNRGISSEGRGLSVPGSAMVV